MDPILNEYYVEGKLDLRTGIPKAEKLKKIDLGSVIEDLERNGVEIK